GRDIFVSKYNWNGIYTGTRVIPGASGNDDAGEAIAVDSSNRAYVGGRYSSGVNLEDPFLMRIGTDAALTLSWSKSLDGGPVGSVEGINGLALDQQSNVYVAGYYGAPNSPDFNDGGGTASFAGVGEDVFVAKYSSAGTFSWARGISAAGDARTLSLATDRSGGVYFCGKFENTVDWDISSSSATTISTGGSDAFVVKMNSSGVLAWAKALGGAGDDAAEAIALDGSGNVILVGNVFGASADIAIFKLTPRLLMFDRPDTDEVLSGNTTVTWMRDGSWANGLKADLEVTDDTWATNTILAADVDLGDLSYAWDLSAFDQGDEYSLRFVADDIIYATVPGSFTYDFAPTIILTTLDFNDGAVYFEFDEVMDVTPGTLVNLNLIHINNTTAVNFITPTAATVTASDSNVVKITLSEADRLAAMAQSGTPPGDGTALVLDMENGAIRDLFRGIQFNAAVLGQQFNEVADSTSPQLVRWNLDMNTGYLELVFDETMDISSFDLSYLAVTNPGGTASRELSTSLLLTAVNSDNVLIAVSATDLSFIKLDPTYATSAADTYIGLNFRLANDLSANDVVEIAIEFPVQVTTFVADSNAPELSSFTLDM
ncbi:MAG: hypothetical protein HQL31_12855, partial [Planctomycetes bacterium]|nr:hypothetical protein [Planctomycetota bacterium]